MGQGVFPLGICVTVTQTVKTTQMSLHLNAKTALTATVLSARKVEKRFALEME